MLHRLFFHFRFRCRNWFLLHRLRCRSSRNFFWLFCWLCSFLFLFFCFCFLFCFFFCFFLCLCILICPKRNRNRAATHRHHQRKCQYTYTQPDFFHLSHSLSFVYFYYISIFPFFIVFSNISSLFEIRGVISSEFFTQ